MTIFRLNFLLKVAHILVCQNPSFISTQVPSFSKSCELFYKILNNMAYLNYLIAS